MKTLDKTPNSRQKHLKMKITDKEKIIRGDRLRKVMDFLKLRTKDFVYDGLNKYGFVSRPSIVSTWLSGGQKTKPNRPGYLSNSSIDYMCATFFPNIRPEMPIIHPNYLKGDSSYMTENEIALHIMELSLHQKEQSQEVRKNDLEKILRNYLESYMFSKGFENITVSDNTGKNISFPTIRDGVHQNILNAFNPGETSISFSSNEKVCSLSVNAWLSMQKEIHDFIAYQVGKNLLQEASIKDLSINKMEESTKNYIWL